MKTTSHDSEASFLGDPHRFLSALVESSDAAIIGKDLDGIIRSWSPGARRLYGYDAGEVIGSSIEILASPDFADELADFLTRIRRGEAVRDHETVRVRKDGRPVDVVLTISPVRGELDEVIGASTIARDITAEKRARTFERLASKVSDAVCLPLGTQAAFQAITQACVESIADFCLASSVDEAGGVHFAAAAHVRESEAEPLAELARHELFAEEAHPLSAAASEGTDLLWTEAGGVQGDDLMAEERVRKVGEVLDATSLLVVPMSVTRRRMGALLLATVEGGRRSFEEADLTGIRGVMSRAALALDNAELVQRSRTSEARLRITLEAARMGTWEWDIEAGTVTWDEVLEEIHGTEAGSFEGTVEAFERGIHPEDRERVREEIRCALADPEVEYRVEYRIVRPNGDVRWLSTSGAVLRDDSGQALRMVGVCMDVTRIKRDEAGERFLSRTAQVLASSMELHEALERIVELAVPDVADLCDLILLEEGEARRVALAHDDAGLEAVAKALAVQVPVDREGMSRRIHGVRPRSIVCEPIEADGEVFGSLTVLQGRSGRRFEETDVEVFRGIASRIGVAIAKARIYERLQETVLELERAVRSRDDVLAFVSHDLKNFLSAIDAGVRAIQELTLGAEQRSDILRRVLATNGRAFQLIEDLLDGARKDAGMLELELASVDPRTLIREVTEPFRDVARWEGVEIQESAAEELPAVRVDSMRIHRVFLNLLTNAVRYAGSGGVVRLEAHSGEEGSVIFAVGDDGPGIPEELRERIFERYWQEEGSRGAGLGLPIARIIVEAHGGELWVECGERGGTEFLCRLPAADG